MSNSVSIYWRSFSIAKSGNRDDENEDVVFPISGNSKINHREPYTFLVADGATQTSFSGLWANCLVESCSKTRLLEPNFWQSIESARESWQQSFEGKEIPWHATEKIRQGAFCALIWLELQYSPLLPGNTFTWKALAVGDCCLFIARNQSIYLSLPIQDSSEFSNSPTLIPSNRGRLDSIKGKIKTARGALRQGDQIILASDAFSAWIMKQSQSGIQIIDIMKNIKSNNDRHGFTVWINSLRKSGELKNDDTSLIIIEAGGKTDGTS